MISNPWIVGIAASVIGAVLYLLLTKLFERVFGKKAYYESIYNANQEVVGVLRNIVSEGVVPTEKIIQALISSYSRKYKVKIEEMFSIHVIKEELIKDLFETSFISTHRKLELSSELIKEDERYVDTKEPIVDLEFIRKTDSIIKMNKIYQLLAMSLSTFVVVYFYIEILFTNNLIIKVDFMPLIAVYFGMVSLTLITLLYLRKRKKRG